MIDLSSITQLGKKSNYSTTYDPELLVAIPRQPCNFPQSGYDIWRAYEVSWLGYDQKPHIETLVLQYSAQSPNIVESKSLKLYLNSLNFAVFNTQQDFIETVKHDLSKALSTEVIVSIDTVMARSTLTGICIDTEQATTNKYTQPNSEMLTTTQNGMTSAVLYSNLFRSCCPVTAQPDWATIHISYSGPDIDKAALLSYLLSFRNHAGFHESCISRIFDDIYQVLEPKQLTVKGFFTRRGGIDINPCRTTQSNLAVDNLYLARQ